LKRLGNDFELTATIADSDRVPLEQPPTLPCAGTGPVKPEVALKAQLRVLLLEHIKAATLPVDRGSCRRPECLRRCRRWSSSRRSPRLR